MPPRQDHEAVATPQGVLAPRFRAAAADRQPERVSLDGTWRFRLFPEAITGADPRDPGTGWDTIDVPGHWQLAGAPSRWPYGTPAYTNIHYPIPLDPPRVPTANPTGEYRRGFTVPSGWRERGRVVLRFEGVDSWFELAVNGVILAQSHGSRLPTEVDVTDVLVDGENLLAARVTQWSAMTYVEDQDQWWLSGIFRPVTLELHPHDGVGHVAVTADFDHTTGTGTLRVDVERYDGAPHPDATVHVPELGLHGRAGETLTAPVEPWSAEVPRLYELEVVSPSETVVMRIGFRTVSTAGGVLTLNGGPIKLYGVNRHEFDPVRGRALTPETMLADVLLMKRHHINAVRTSHYPPHPHFLDLCDEYGLYVIDEGDMETHGFVFEGWAGNPVADPEWRDVLVNRVQRLVRRDAHHPSVIMWSLGNEAGRGCNVEPMVAAVRELDLTRPVHYEADKTYEFADVYSRMYPELAELEEIVAGVDAPQPADGPLPTPALHAHRASLPFLLCEYAFAMGNGPGGLTEHVDLLDTHERAAGGFIWEWIDHCLAIEEPDGTTLYGYGGDFGEEFHDGTFVVDGLVFPDRSPSPGLHEVAAVYAPVGIRPCGGDELTVRNRYAFRTLEHVELRWELVAGGDVIAAGRLDPGALAPGQTTAVRAADHVGGVDLPPRVPVWWVLRAVWRRHTRPAWAQSDDVLGLGQVLLRPADPPEPAAGTITERADGWQVGPLRLDQGGRLVAVGGTPVAEARVDAWRAPTDNDRRTTFVPAGGRTATAPDGDARAWEVAGLGRLHESVRSVTLDGDALVVAARAAGAGTSLGFDVRYVFRAVDATSADVSVEITPVGQWPGTLARIGWLLALVEPDAAEVVVDWTGQGPGESYPDSTRAAHAGRWQHTVAHWQTPYVSPQENGARRGVTTATFALAGGPLRLSEARSSLRGRHQDGVTLSARPWSDQAIAAAGHVSELVPDGKLWIHLDAAMHGLGTAALGPGPVPGARLWPAPATVRFRITAR